MSNIAKKSAIISLVVIYIIFILFEFSRRPTGGYIWGDFKVYINAVNGDYSQFFYPYWFLAVIKLFSYIPLPIAMLFWSIINIYGVYKATRAFGGKWLLSLLSFQMIYSLWVGQVVGIVLGGLTILYCAIEDRQFYIAGIGFLLSLSKPQMGLPLAIGIIIMARPSIIDLLKLSTASLSALIISLFVFPGWPYLLINSIQNTPPNSDGSITLWNEVGPRILLLWIPTMILPMKKIDRYILIVCSQAITLPYFQQTDLLILFTFPIGWMALLGNLEYLLFEFGWSITKILIILPVLLYITIMLKSLPKSVFEFIELYR